MNPVRRELPLERTRAAGFVLAWAIAVALAGRIEIPFVPVPFTLQTLAAMGAGLTLGPRQGAAAVALTLLAGAAGLPAFPGGGAGLAHLTGPTGGYLWALPALAALYGLTKDRLWIALLASLGHLFLGATWLAAYVGPTKALAVGVAPFLIPELAKGALALGAARIARQRS